MRMTEMDDKGRERNRNSVRSFRGGEQVRCTWSHRDSISSENDLGTQLLSVCWGVAAWEGSSTSTAEPNQDMATHPPVQDRPKVSCETQPSRLFKRPCLQRLFSPLTESNYQIAGSHYKNKNMLFSSESLPCLLHKWPCQVSDFLP